MSNGSSSKELADGLARRRCIDSGKGAGRGETNPFALIDQPKQRKGDSTALWSNRYFPTGLRKLSSRIQLGGYRRHVDNTDGVLKRIEAIDQPVPGYPHRPTPSERGTEFGSHAARIVKERSKQNREDL